MSNIFDSNNRSSKLCDGDDTDDGGGEAGVGTTDILV
jgi:hypothetical protein